MTTHRRVGGWLLAATFAGGVIWAASSFASAGPVGIGMAAPEFRAVSIEDPSTFKTASDYRGQVVLINLWATWCGPCVVEMPSIQRLYSRYRDRGFKVVAVAVDDPPFTELVRTFVRERGLTFEVLHEGSGRIEQDYGARGIPATYVLGRDGRIRLIRQGAADWDTPTARALIEQLLSDGTAPDTRGTP